MTKESIIHSIECKQIEKALKEDPRGSIHDFFEVYRNDYPYANIVTATVTFVLFVGFLIHGGPAALAIAMMLLGVCAFSVIKIMNNTTCEKQYVQRFEMLEIVAKAYANKSDRNQ